MNKLLTHLIALAMVVIFFASASHAACLQPVYIIAHRCNGETDVSEVVKQQGVNAIEADFRQDEYTKLWWVDHDGIWPSWSTPIESWLNDVKNAIADSERLALVIFDIKTPEGDLLSLHEQARTSLGDEINLIFSIGDFGESFFAYHLQQQFKDALNQDSRAGSAIDYLTGSETQAQVQDFFGLVGITDYWFADGITAAFPTPLSVYENVSAGLNLRDISLQSCGDRFHGVYTWTYEQANSITQFLSKAGHLLYPFQIAGVNGIFMNAAECFGRIDPVGAMEPKEAVAFAKLAQPLTGTKFADRKHNPFEVPAPGITCPSSTTVECSSPGGVDRDDSQLDAFFGGAIIDTRGCNAVSDAEVDAPEFFFLDEQAPVIFTAADEGVCRPSSSCAADVTVADTIEPIITKITATPDMLWPPNGKIVPVNIDVVSADICDTGPVCQIASVTSNEPEGRLGSRSHSSDWRITEGLGLELRAERSGRGDGRIYTITVECADASGNRAQGAVAVGVPHDQR